MSASRDLDDFASLSESRGHSNGNYALPLDSGRLLADISNNVLLFNKNVSTLEHRVAMLDRSQDDTPLLEEILQLLKDSAQLAKYADSSLKKMSPQRAGLSVSERAQYDRLLKGFTNSFTRFTQLQQRTIEIEQKKHTDADSARKVESNPFHDSDKGSEHPADRDDDRMLEPSGHRQHQMYSDMDLPEVEERDVAIHQLESDILGINEIFRDLATMVQEQGETIDHIEANVEQGAMRVVEGNKQLKKAIAHKTCSRRLTCCIIIIVSAVVIVVIIAILIVLGALNVYTGGK